MKKNIYAYTIFTHLHSGAMNLVIIILGHAKNLKKVTTEPYTAQDYTFLAGIIYYMKIISS